MQMPVIRNCPTVQYLIYVGAVDLYSITTDKDKDIYITRFLMLYVNIILEIRSKPVC